MNVLAHNSLWLRLMFAASSVGAAASLVWIQRLQDECGAGEGCAYFGPYLLMLPMGFAAICLLVAAVYPGRRDGEVVRALACLSECLLALMALSFLGTSLGF